MKHTLKVQLLSRRVVLRCSCNWMMIMPRDSNSSVLDAMQEHRKLHNDIDGFELDGNVTLKMLNLVQAIASFK